MLPPGQACIAVRWIEPSVTDDSGIVNVDSLTIQQNTCLNAGDNQVMYIFSDPSGNLATCAFTITVTAGMSLGSQHLFHIHTPRDNEEMFTDPSILCVSAMTSTPRGFPLYMQKCFDCLYGV